MPSPTSPPPEPRPEPPTSTRRSRARARSTLRRTPRPIAATPTSDAPSPDESAPALPQAPTGERVGGADVAALVAAGILEAVPGQPPVPVSVWHAGPPGQPSVSGAGPHRGLTPTLAARLLAIYTDPGQTVIDATDDPAVAGAAGAGARGYLSASWHESARPLEPMGEVGLILLRWPIPDPSHPPAGPASRSRARAPELKAVLRTCAALLCSEGHTVMILPPPSEGTYRKDAATLIAAARRAGLGYLRHLVVITTGSQHPWPAPRQGTERSMLPPAAAGEPARAPEHLDLLVFVLRQSRPGSRS